jgi:mannosyltransferase OCH1-like enzyme
MVPTYLSYPYPIQRVDALRYMLVHHYGGIYIDLDLFTYKPLTPLLTYPAVACRTSPTGISNDILVATPNHPFFSLVLKRLEWYNRNLIVQYLTIMYTTGPLFLSAIWIEYLGGLKKGGNALERVRVLIPRPVSGDNFGMWKNIQGGSWHGDDMYVIFWLGDHLILATLIGFAIGLLAVTALWTIYTKCHGTFKTERWAEIQKTKQRQR